MEVKPLEIVDCKVLSQELENENGSDSSTQDKKMYKCNECESTFTQGVDLKTHRLTVHRVGGRFQCSTCDYVTFSKKNLEDHLLVRTGKNAHKCIFCDYTCEVACEMKRHQVSHIKKSLRPYKCNECESTFTRGVDLKTHRLTVHRVGGRFQCSTCDYVTFSKKNLEDHLFVRTSKNAYKCNFCDYTCEVACEMKRHQVSHSKIRLRPYKCDECESTFTLESSLKAHRLSVHSGVIRFKCSTCDFGTLHKGRLISHLLLHSSGNPFKCNICEFVCKEAGSLERHLITHSTVKRHKCDECESIFTLESSLKAHKLSVHRQAKRFKCCTCDYITFFKSALKKHLLVHAIDNSFNCTKRYCLCKEASRMRNQYLVDSIVKPYKCDECESTFTVASRLKTHQLAVHKGATRFTCPTCSYGTFYKQKLESHLLTHNVQKLHSCMDCNYYTKSASLLQFHLWHHIVTLKRSGTVGKFSQ